MTGTPEPASTQGEDLGLRDTTPRGEIEAVLLALAHAPARQLELGPDDRVGRFSVIRTIGHGGSGVVHEARDLDLGRHVALKVMRTRGDPSSRSAEALESMFKREADAAARLNHPNIVTLFDFGTHEGSPYLILELLHGETLEARIARGPLTVREAVAVMIQIAQGVAYAHRLGVVHRDLKPANVFLTSEGPVKVLDFGLARLQAAVGLPDAAAITDSSPTNLTTRALIGTPAYMAPEQWRAETADPRTDVFAAGLILYEMLTGRRPWPAADPRVAALAPQPVPAVVGVPAPLARLIAQAVTKHRAARLASASELLDGLVAVRRTLDSEQVVRRNRRIRRVLLAAVPLLVGGSWAGSLLVQRAARDAEVDALVAQADGMTARARDGEPEVAALRERAFVLFDARLLDAAEAVWEEARARGAALDHEWAQAGAVLERAFVTGVGRADVRRRLGDVLLARARIAERDHDVEDRDELGDRLTTFGDAAALASWRAPARLVLSVFPASHVVVERYDDREVVVVGELATTTEVELDLPPGSYRLHLWAAGHPEVMWPVLLGRGESVRGAVSIPARVPEGLVYIPEGRFLYGCADEPIRENFHAQPEHPVTTGAYLIGRHEVTFGEWIRYLEALAPAERARRLPRVATEARGTTAVNSGGDDLALRELGDGHWRLTFRDVEARDDEPWVYADRTGRRTQNWLRFPVMGISFDDGVAYAAWLARTGQVPGARLCDEHEWERAARGADGRTFPNGPRLAPDDANIDVTYGQKDRAFGLDEVGSHPRSDSPFGVSDLAGNVWEWTRSVSDFEQPSWERGSSFFQDALTARSYNREYIPRTFRTHLIGLRICASTQPVH